MPSSPCAPAAVHSSRGTIPARSHVSWKGATCFSRNVRTLSRKSSCWASYRWGRMPGVWPTVRDPCCEDPPVTTTDRQPVLPEDLGRFADIAQAVLSRDGTRVAVAVSLPDVAANRYRRDVLTGPVDDAAPLTLLDPQGSVRLPRWSLADDRLAVVVDRPGGCEVRLVAPGGSVTTAVAGWPDPVEELAWSPDGARLLFVVREPVDRAWYELPEDRRPPRRLTTLGYREDGVGWTVDRPRQAYLVDADGGAAPTKLSIGGFDDAEFAWHPDGRSVYFVGKRHEGADRSIV